MKLRLILASAAFAVTPPLFAQSVVKGDAAKGAEIAGKVCAACHGPDGNSPLAANPNRIIFIPDISHFMKNSQSTTQ